MSRATKQMSVTIANHVMDQLNARAGRGAVSPVITSNLKRYYDLMAWTQVESIERFAFIGELSALFEVWGNVPRLLGHHDAIHYVSIDQSDSWERHGASRMTVESILNAMTMIHVVAMVDMCEIFWAGAESGAYDTVDDLISAIHPAWRGLKVKRG